MFNVEQLKHRSAVEGRVKIAPRVVVSVDTEQRKQEIIRVLNRVMAEHHEVLLALKNR